MASTNEPFCYASRPRVNSAPPRDRIAVLQLPLTGAHWTGPTHALYQARVTWQELGVCASARKAMSMSKSLFRSRPVVERIAAYG